MSQFGDHTRTLVEMIKKYPTCEHVVIETFFETITNQSWSEELIIDMLDCGKGISETADVILDKFINRASLYGV